MESTVYSWEIDKAREQSSETLKNWIWMAVNNGSSIPGCMSVLSLRMVLRERGEDGCGYHDT